MSQRLIFISLLAAFLMVGCRESTSSSGPVQKAPAELARGEALFNTHCARCHGEGAKGTNQGPPFLSKIYEPNHHGDAAFQLAPQKGVRAHHWNFGDMPKIEGVRPEEVNEIIHYVRWLQKEAGIF